MAADEIVRLKTLESLLLILEQTLKMIIDMFLKDNVSRGIKFFQ